MHEITKEQIDEAVCEVLSKVSKTVFQDYLDATEYIPDDQKDNPMYYHELCVSVAINKSSEIVSETLKKLLTD